MRTNNFLKSVNEYLKVKRNKRRVTLFASAIAVALISVAMFTLRMPAFTTEQDPSFICGHHQHTEMCNIALVCHNEEGAYIHAADCMEEPEEKLLVCQEEETPGHTHDENCNTIQVLACTMEEVNHEHDGNCYGEQELVCTYVSSGEEDEPEHMHDSFCYIDGPLVCEITNYAHGDDCYETQLDCDIEEDQGHAHGEDCYEYITPEHSCDGTEYSHGPDCYMHSDDPQCGLEEEEHTEECFQVDDSFSLNGTGTQDDPFEIAMAVEFAFMAQQVNAGEEDYINAYYSLTDSIDLSELGMWAPIGTQEFPFGGVFEGSGNTVDGLNIHSNSLNDAGLFGYVDGGTIRNIGVRDVYVIAGTNVGGLVGFITSGEVTNAFVTGTVMGKGNVGGLVGNVASGEVANAYAVGSVVGDTHVGGLIGQAGSATVSNTYTINHVTGSDSAGGVAGFVGEESVVVNSVALNPAIISESAGRIADVEDGTLSNNYAFENILDASGEPAWARGGEDFGEGYGDENGIIEIAPVEIASASFSGALSMNGGELNLGNSTLLEETAAESKNGEGITPEEIASANFWEGTASFSQNNWEIENGFLPILNGISGQSGEIPAFLGIMPLSTGVPHPVYNANELKAAFRSTTITEIRLMNDISLSVSTSNAASANSTTNHYLVAGAEKALYGNGFTLDLRNNVIRVGSYDLTLVGDLTIMADPANQTTGSGIGMRPEATISGSAGGTFTIQATEGIRNLDLLNPGWAVEPGDTVKIQRRNPPTSLLLDWTTPINTDLISGFGSFIFEEYSIFNASCRTNRMNQNDGNWQSAVIHSDNNSLFEVQTGAKVTLIADHDGNYTQTNTAANTHGTTALVLRRPDSNTPRVTQEIKVAEGGELNVVAYGTGSNARAWSPVLILHNLNTLDLTNTRPNSNRAISETTIEGSLNVFSNNGNGWYYNYTEDGYAFVTNRFTVKGGTVNIVGARRGLTETGTTISVDDWFQTSDWNARAEQVRNLPMVNGIGLDMEYAAFESYGPMTTEINIINGGTMNVHNKGLRAMSLAGRSDKTINVDGAGSKLEMYGLLWAIAAEHYARLYINVTNGADVSMASSVNELSLGDIVGSSSVEARPGSTIYVTGRCEIKVDGRDTRFDIEHRGGSFGAIFADTVNHLGIHVTGGAEMNVSSRNSGSRQVEADADRATITAQTALSAHHRIVVSDRDSVLRVWNDNTRRTNDSSLYPRGAIALAANTQGSIEVKNGGSLYARSNNQMSPTISLGGYNINTGNGRFILDNPGTIDIRNDAEWDLIRNPNGTVNTVFNSLTLITTFRNPVALRATDYVISFSLPCNQNNINSSNRIAMDINNTKIITVWPVWQGKGLLNTPRPTPGTWDDPGVSGAADRWSVDTIHNTWNNIQKLEARNNEKSVTAPGIGDFSYKGNVIFPEPPSNSDVTGYAHRGTVGTASGVFNSAPALNTQMLYQKRRNTIDVNRSREEFILSDYGRIYIEGAPPTMASLSMDKDVYSDPYEAGMDVGNITDQDWRSAATMPTGSQALFKIEVTNNSAIAAPGVVIEDAFEMQTLLNPETIVSIGTGQWYNGQFQLLTPQPEYNPATGKFTLTVGAIPGIGQGGAGSNKAVYYYLTDELSQDADYKNTATIKENRDYSIAKGSDEAIVRTPEADLQIDKDVYWEAYRENLNFKESSEDNWRAETTLNNSGQQALFRITVRNESGRTARGVLLEDVLQKITQQGNVVVGGSWYGVERTWNCVQGCTDEASCTHPEAIIERPINPELYPFDVPGNGTVTFYYISDALESGEYENKATIKESIDYIITKDSDTATVTVVKSGPALPETGGIGATLYWIAGASLMILALILMGIKKGILAPVAAKRRKSLAKRGMMDRDQ